MQTDRGIGFTCFERKAPSPQFPSALKIVCNESSWIKSHTWFRWRQKPSQKWTFTYDEKRMILLYEQTWKSSKVWYQYEMNMVFCYHNRFDLLWEKNVVAKFEIRAWKPKICKIFEITRTIYLTSERSDQLL